MAYWSIREFQGVKLSLCTVLILFSSSDYIQIRQPVYLSHTAGRYAAKRFRKAQCPIIERLTNSLMMNGRNSGKKLMAMRIVSHAFDIVRSFNPTFNPDFNQPLILIFLAFQIHIMTDQNPIQVAVDAIVNCGPREDCKLDPNYKDKVRFRRERKNPTKNRTLSGICHNG